MARDSLPQLIPRASQRISQLSPSGSSLLAVCARTETSPRHAVAGSVLVPALLLLSAATHRSDTLTLLPPALIRSASLFHSLVTAAAHRASPCSAEESTRVLVGETMPACRYAMAGGATGLQGRHAND